MAEVTEHQPVACPIVIGLLRAQCREGRTTALASALREYCIRHELSLGEIVTISAKADPRFKTLVQSFSRNGTYAVVVPSKEHLGSSELVQERSDLISEARLRLIVIRGLNPRHVAA